MNEGRTENFFEGSSESAVMAGHIDGVHFHQASSPEVTTPADDLREYKVLLRSRVAIAMSRTGLLDGLSGGRSRRVQRTARRLEAAFAGETLTGEAAASAARLYRKAMRLALIIQPQQAVGWFEAYDRQIPAEYYMQAFQDEDAAWMAWLVRAGDLSGADAVFELATRMRLRPLQISARKRGAELLRRFGDGNILIRHCRRWLEEGLLDRPTLTYSLEPYLSPERLDREKALWSSFFRALPESVLPDHFEVHCFLGHGAQAVSAADTKSLQRRAVQCCLSSPRLEDVNAGLDLARHTLRDQAAVRRLAAHAGDLLRDAGELAQAAERYHEADRDDLASECYEQLGQFVDAISYCPSDQPGRLAMLAGACRPEIDSLARLRNFTEAVALADDLLRHLDRASEDIAEVQRGQDEISVIRGDLISAARQYFARTAEQSAPAEQQETYADWSAFEEACGDVVAAAQRAEDGDDHYRASQLFRRAGRFGDADRVLRGERTPKALATRAEAREAGGDLVGAARFYADCGEIDHAVELFIRAGQHAEAAHSLVESLGDEAVNDARLVQCLRHTGEYDYLVTLCLQAVERTGLNSPVVQELRALRDERVVPARLTPAVEQMIARQEEEARRPFEGRVQAWVAQALGEIDQRFSRIWGLDLGTTTCVAAIYDTELARPVLCEWRGSKQFAATLSVDRSDNEVVGLAGEEILASWVRGHISSSKRKMGTRARYKFRDRSYRPEEVAARFIRHARGMVETLLTAHVRERVRELAYAELGEMNDKWMAWAEQHHNMRLERPQVLVTIPAYFTNNQKDATRAACTIAGVELVRLIHEPTAACMAAARERSLAGRVVVVDLGAGTLDVSLLEVEDHVHEVQKVLGNNQFGGNDLDATVTQALRGQLAYDGIGEKLTARDEQRLSVAAENLKVTLSDQDEAEYSLIGFADRDFVRLSLTRYELGKILAAPLRTLRETCSTFKESLGVPADHLVLVGRPMKSPLVKSTIEDAFGIQRTVVSDPLTAVASGAALQGAVLDQKLQEVLLLDVTPLALGIRAQDPKGHEQFSILIEANTRIPVSRKKEYSTAEDNQPNVAIEVFNGQLGSESKIGQFNLTDIRPGPRGKPRITVKFSIDASCVLKVTALDNDTGKSSSIDITDTTLLSPAQIAKMALSYEAERLRERHRRALELTQRELRELIDESHTVDISTAWQEFARRKAAHRTSSAPLDEATGRTLLEIFSSDHQLHLDLELAGRSLPQVTAQAQAYLDHAEARELVDDLEAAWRVQAELAARLDEVRPLLATLGRWTSVLAALAMTDPDPLRRFRNQYDAKNYHAAVETLRELDVPLSEVDDIERQLHCLSETGNTDEYRAVLLANAGRLHAYPFTSEGLSGPSGNVASVLARITRVLPDGSRFERNGFFLGDGLVVTNGHWLGGTESVHVRMGTEARTWEVRDICRPEADAQDVALLKLAEPPADTAARCGYPTSVRIGDRVWAFAAMVEGGTAQLLIPGLVDMFEAQPGGSNVFRVGMELPCSCSGGPLFNDLGEVIGILTLDEECSGTASGSVSALTSDALRPLLDPGLSLA